MKASHAIAALALVAVACGSSPDEHAASAPVCTTPPAATVTTIVVNDGGFSPACAKVAANQPITFRNEGALPHTATDAGQALSFDLSLPANGSTATHTFPTGGATFQAFCRVHPTMRAAIFVE
jgi:plastocyanin